MTSKQIKPTGITLDKEQHELRITWPEGQECHYPLDALREACPCATCRGGHEYMESDFDPDLLTIKVTATYTVNDIQLVGSYAIQFWWSDGHNSGIYTFDYLHRICPELTT